MILDARMAGTQRGRLGQEMAVMTRQQMFKVAVPAAFILLLLVVLVLTGCRSSEDDFAKAKQYVEKTSPNAFDAGQFAQFVKPLYDRRDPVSFLISKSVSGNPKDTILACLLLDDLVYNVNRHPTPAGKNLIQPIQKSVLVAQLDSIQTNALDATWSYWCSSAKGLIQEHLASVPAGDEVQRKRDSTTAP